MNTIQMGFNGLYGLRGWDSPGSPSVWRCSFNGLYGLRGWDTRYRPPRIRRCFNGLYGLRGWDSAPENLFTIIGLWVHFRQPQFVFGNFVSKPLIFNLLFL